MRATKLVLAVFLIAAVALPLFAKKKKDEEKQDEQKEDGGR